jgi:DNA-binding IclR family transcriptional regulator
LITVARPAPGADRTVTVLELLASQPEARFTLSEVARRCELNKATAHALLSALAERGVLLRHPDEKRYSLGPRLVAIGDAARRGYTAIDFAPGALERLARATGLWARAWRVADDRLLCTAQAGAPAELATLPFVSLPLVPPVGALFMAWSDGPTVEAWLARASSSDAVQPAIEALPAIRRQGFATTPSSPAWTALSQTVPDRAGTGTTGAGTVGGHSDESHDRHRRLLAALSRRPLLVQTSDDEATCRVCDVTAPVFGPAGQVELALSLTLPPDTEMPGGAVSALGEQVVAGARDLTASVGGHRP